MSVAFNCSIKALKGQKGKRLSSVINAEKASAFV